MQTFHVTVDFDLTIDDPAALTSSAHAWLTSVLGPSAGQPDVSELLVRLATSTPGALNIALARWLTSGPLHVEGVRSHVLTPQVVLHEVITSETRPALPVASPQRTRPRPTPGSAICA